MAQKSVFKKLEQIVDIASMSKADRIKYDESIKKYRDTLAVMSGQWLEGKAEGKAEGKTEGRMETAVELMKEKFPMEKIAKVTKLSMEKLQELGRMNGLL